MGCKSSEDRGARDRVAKVLALIAREPEFAFTVFEVEEHLSRVLNHFGVHEDFSIQEEFLLKEALVPLAVDAESMRSLREGSGWQTSPNRAAVQLHRGGDDFPSANAGQRRRREARRIARRRCEGFSVRHRVLLQSQEVASSPDGRISASAIIVVLRKSRAVLPYNGFLWPRSNAVRAPAKDSFNQGNPRQRVDGERKERMKSIYEIIGESSDASFVLEENIGRVVNTDRRAQ